jgi:hydrogenase maturation protease
VLEPAAEGCPREGAVPAVEAHGIDPGTALRLAAAMGGRVGRLLVVGCEPAPAAEEWREGLSEPVRAAVEEAVRLVEALVGRLLRGDPAAATATGVHGEQVIPEKEVTPCPNQ